MVTRGLAFKCLLSELSTTSRQVPAEPVTFPGMYANGALKKQSLSLDPMLCFSQAQPVLLFLIRTLAWGFHAWTPHFTPAFDMPCD